MAQYKYSTKIENEENIAKAAGRDLGISTKQTIEVCNAIRGKSIDDARKILQGAISKKTPIEFKRFTAGAGHKKGIGPGKYPVKCCTQILELLNQTAANASFKGLSTSSMIIKSLCPQTAAKRWHYGRQRRRKMKRTNLEIVLEEQEKKKETKKAEGKPAVKTEEKKVEEKKSVEKKEAVKTEEKKVEVKKEEKVEKEEEEPKKESTAEKAVEKKAEAPKEKKIEESKPAVKKQEAPKKEEAAVEKPKEESKTVEKKEEVKQ